MTADSPAALAQEIRVGDNRELRLLAARGLVPVPLEELVTLQVYLTGVDDAEISRAAAESLRDLEPQAAAGVIAGQRLGTILQARITTNADVGDARIVGISRGQRGSLTIHRITVEG